MAIFGISDLHLSFGVDKPMDIFGDHWANHDQQMKKHWIDTITDEDIVLVPGDISWAMNFDEFIPDLDFMRTLPGFKILVRGNHDYWWSSISKVRQLIGGQGYAIQNDSLLLPNGIAIAGTRGWNCPGDKEFSEHDKKIYLREVTRLELSLSHAKKQNPSEIWVMMHYMPTNDRHQRNEMIELLESYQVKKVVYGHLHSYGHGIKIDGTHWNIEFHLIASDYLQFRPKLLSKE